MFPRSHYFIHSTCMCQLLSRIRLFVTPWTIACQAPLSMEFSSQEYHSGLPFPSPGDLPNPGIKPGSPALQAGSLPSEPPGTPQIMIKYLLDYQKQSNCVKSITNRQMIWADVSFDAISSTLGRMLAQSGYSMNIA